MKVTEKDTGLVKIFGFGELTREEARKIRRQKELEKMPTLENKFKRLKRNAERREERIEFEKKLKARRNRPVKRRIKLL